MKFLDHQHPGNKVSVDAYNTFEALCDALELHLSGLEVSEKLSVLALAVSEVLEVFKREMLEAHGPLRAGQVRVRFLAVLATHHVSVRTSSGGPEDPSDAHASDRSP